MICRWSLALIAGLMFVSAGLAQSPAPTFHWKPGQILKYRVSQATKVTETVEEKKSETVSRQTNQKRWQVLEVDADGIATLQLSLTALRVETTTPDGKTRQFDSADAGNGDAAMREQLEKYLGKPLAVLRVDAHGKVVEVKECQFGSPNQFESKPPFVLVLPNENKESWERAYSIKTTSSSGADVACDAVQNYVVQAAAEGKIKVGITTTLKTKPEEAAEQAPLLQMLPEGQALFDVQSGIFLKAKLQVDKELKDHVEAGSNYHFQSVYVEEYLGEN